MKQKQTYSRRPLVGINGSMLDERPTGVGQCTLHIVNQLAVMDNGDQDRYVVFSPNDTHLSEKIRCIKLPALLQSSKFGKVAALSRFLWNTFVYPFSASNCSLLLSTTSHGSFFHRNQIITIHDLLSLRFDNISAHQRVYFRRILPLIISRSKGVIAVSENTKNEIVRLLNCPEEKITVIHNGYDPVRFHAENLPTGTMHDKYGVKNYILAVGPTYQHKNFERLLNAYASLDVTLRDKHPLVIAGGLEPYLSELKALTAKLGIGDKVRFLGYVPQEDMPPLYREATLFIFPSLYEGFGLPLLEAMASGCPVVSSHTSSMPEVCGDAARYADPLDTEDIRKAMDEVLSSPGLRKELIEKGLRRCRLFTWEATAKSYRDLITHYELN